MRPLSLRWRLTAVIGSLALTAGAALAGLAYLLVSRALAASARPDAVRFVDSQGRSLVLPVAPGEVGRVLDAVAEQVQADALASLLQASLLALVVVGVVAIASAWLAAGRVLRPLQQITATAQRLSTETLDSRIALTGPPDELKELADTFDAMLGRLDAAFASQRRFVADASHELRTPLAVMRTEVDVALADPDASPTQLREMGVVVREATERADRLVDSLLLLARSDATGLAVREPVPLDDVVAAAVASAAREAAAADVSVTVSGDGAADGPGASAGRASVLGDRALLERLVGNLVDNAVRHNVPGGWVAVRTVPAGQPVGGADPRLLLQLANSGPGVDTAEVDELFEPFRRAGGRTAARGTGLGLAIVRSLARAHGGEVSARALAEGGLEVTVDLPAAT